MTEFLARPPVLILLCGAGYALATVWMKTAAASPAWPVLVAIAVCLSASVVAEVLLLRQHSIGVIYLAIIVTESLLVLFAAFLIGDGLSLRQVFGAVVILIGAGIVSA